MLAGVFRGVFPAASLKQAIRHHAVAPCDSPSLRFPRGIPRGLIEAGAAREYDVNLTVVFRGVFPAASLKRSAPPRDHLAQASCATFSAGYSPRPH